MAHIGRVWKLAKRRDFNLNVQTNNDGWADRYVGHIRFFAFGIGAVLNQVDFTCGPSFNSQVDELDWQSEFKRLALFFYKMELLVQIPNGKSFLRQISFNISGHGTILVAEWPTIYPRDFPGFPIGRELTIKFWSEDWFDAEPKSMIANLAPVTWAAGPLP